MTVDGHFQAFILSNKSSVPSAVLLSLQILTGNLCCSSRGKNFKANEHQRNSERRRTGSFHIRLSCVKKKSFFLSLNGWDLLISPQLPALQSPPACPSMHVFWVGNVLFCYVSSFFSWKRANSNVLLLQSYDFLSYDFLHLDSSLHTEHLPFLTEWKSS